MKRWFVVAAALAVLLFCWLGYRAVTGMVKHAAAEIVGRVRIGYLPVITPGEVKTITKYRPQPFEVVREVQTVRVQRDTLTDTLPGLVCVVKRRNHWLVRANLDRDSTTLGAFDCWRNTVTVWTDGERVLTTTRRLPFDLGVFAQFGGVVALPRADSVDFDLWAGVTLQPAAWLVFRAGPVWSLRQGPGVRVGVEWQGWF